MNLPPNVDYYESFMGIAPAYLLSNPVAFPSNADGYQDMSVSTEPIGYSTGPSLEHPSNASIIDKPLANGSSGGLPRGHVCPTGQVHHVQEKDTRLVFPCRDPTLRIVLSSILY